MKNTKNETTNMIKTKRHKDPITLASAQRSLGSITMNSRILEKIKYREKKKLSSSPIHHQHITLPAISSRTDIMARTIKRASIFSLLIALAQFVRKGNVRINITQILPNINSMSSNS